MQSFLHEWQQKGGASNGGLPSEAHTHHFPGTRAWDTCDAASCLILKNMLTRRRESLRHPFGVARVLARVLWGKVALFVAHAPIIR